MDIRQLNPDAWNRQKTVSRVLNTIWFPFREDFPSVLSTLSSQLTFEESPLPFPGCTWFLPAVLPKGIYGNESGFVSSGCGVGWGIYSPKKQASKGYFWMTQFLHIHSSLPSPHPSHLPHPLTPTHPIHHHHHPAPQDQH